MTKTLLYFFLAFVVIFVIDQQIKQIFIDGYRYTGPVISLTFVLNNGVAFSMFAFLGAYLKYIQIAILLGVFGYLLYDRLFFTKLSIAFGMLLGAGASNVYDRFIHGGVVDYVYWHYGFDFAVFNFADVMIDVAVVLIVYVSIFKKDEASKAS
jgi:signal peptidase II